MCMNNRHIRTKSIEGIMVRYILSIGKHLNGVVCDRSEFTLIICQINISFVCDDFIAYCLVIVYQTDDERRSK